MPSRQRGCARRAGIGWSNMKSNRLSRMTLACVAAIAFGTLAQSAHAQPTPAQQNAVRQQCRTDFRVLCSHVKPGGSEALACLGEHAERLSPACQDAVFATMPAEPAEHAAVKRTPDAAAAPPPRSTATAKPVAIRSVAPPPARPAKRPIGRSTAIAVAAPAAAPPPAPSAAAPLKHVAVPPPPAAAIKHTALPPPTAAKLKHAAVPPPHPPRAPVANASGMVRACQPDLARLCRRVRPGGNRELACLAAHRTTLTWRCRAALQVTLRTR